MPIVFDWTGWLLAQNNDIISGSTMSFTAVGSTDTALVITSPASSFTSTTATVWPSVGTLGMVYNIYNTITTVGGITRTKVVKITIRNETP